MWNLILYLVKINNLGFGQKEKYSLEDQVTTQKKIMNSLDKYGFESS